MSTALKQLNAKFRILASQKKSALAAIKLLPGHEPNLDIEPHDHFDFVDFATLSTDDKGRPTSFRYLFMDSETLEDALEKWNWHPEVDSNGDIMDLTFTGIGEGDYEILFAQIAPFVEAGSHIEMVNEYGWHRDHVFDGIKSYDVTLETISNKMFFSLFGFATDQ